MGSEMCIRDRSYTCTYITGRDCLKCNFQIGGFRYATCEKGEIKTERTVCREGKTRPATKTEMFRTRRHSGALVKWIVEISDSSRMLSKGDIAAHFDGVSATNAEAALFRSGERIGLDFWRPVNIVKIL